MHDMIMVLVNIYQLLIDLLKQNCLPNSLIGNVHGSEFVKNEAGYLSNLGVLYQIVED